MVTWEIINQVEDENVWISYFKKQIFEKNNCVNTVLTGKTGSGKSWAMLKLAYMYNPDFEFEGTLFFRGSQFMKALRDYYKPTVHHTKGKLWLFDEAGVDLNNLKYHDAINKGFNAWFQTGRHRNYLFLCSVPYMDLLSKGVRTLLKSQFRIKGFNSEKLTTILPRLLEYNDDKQKLYKKRLLVKTLEGTIMPCNQILISPPPKKLVREYEKFKAEFSSSVMAEAADEMEAFELKKRRSMGKDLTERQHNVMHLLQKGYRIEDVAKELNIGKYGVYSGMTGAKKKGWQIIPVREEKGTKMKKYKVIPPVDYKPPETDKK